MLDPGNTEQDGIAARYRFLIMNTNDVRNPVTIQHLLTGIVGSSESLCSTKYDPEAESRAYVAEAKAKTARDRWEHSCPPAYKVSNFDHPELVPFAAQIKKVLSHQIGSKGLLLTGETGRGKTRSMWQLMRRLAFEEGLDARYWTANAWFSKLQTYIEWGRDDANEWVKAMAGHRIVFIDDFGKEALLDSKRDWAQGWFFEFLNIRVENGLPLFLTTNMSSKEIAAVSGGGEILKGRPVVRRLLELCEVVKFELSLSDERGS